MKIRFVEALDDGCCGSKIAGMESVSHLDELVGHGAAVQVARFEHLLKTGQSRIHSFDLSLEGRLQLSSARGGRQPVRDRADSLQNVLGLGVRRLGGFLGFL